MSERSTIRPVTLARLAELTYACAEAEQTTEDLEDSLGVTHRRARETILEAVRIGLVTEREGDTADEAAYQSTDVGRTFVAAIQDEDWQRVSDVLRTRSPHYGAFLDAVAELEPASPDDVLEYLESHHQHSRYGFNQTSIDVVGDWGDRLGAIQRNAFTGSYYRSSESTVPQNFPYVLLSVFEELEETAGVNLSQRYLSIPELREQCCERLRCTRAAFDNALVSLATENVGKLELSGAPIDTGAKEATLGIKQISVADVEGLVSTDQSTDRVMAGVEQFGKQYYYLAVHDDDLTFTTETDT